MAFTGPSSRGGESTTTSSRSSRKPAPHPGKTSWKPFKPDSPLRKEFQTFVAASKERLQQGRLSFQRFLTECLISFKDPNYREENEWRAIQFGHPGVEVCFRDANGRITPYCKLDITHAGQPPGKLPIQSIRYGPTLETREASRGLKMLVSASGYPNVSVEPSNIRFRTR